MTSFQNRIPPVSGSGLKGFKGNYGQSMTYKGKTTRNTRCAICKEEIPRGSVVYFDSTKSQGSHLAHVECWDALCASRRAQPAYQKPKKKKAGIQSTEPLEPPF